MPALSVLAAKLRLPRRTLRVQLTLLYAGFFFVCGVAVLLVPVLTVKQSIPQGASPAAIAQIQADSRGQVIRAAATVVGLVTISLAVGWLIAGRFLRPLHAITAIAQDISASSLERRVALGHRDDEFSDLGKTLDGLFSRLNEQVRREQASRRFFKDHHRVPMVHVRRFEESQPVRAQLDHSSIARPAYRAGKIPAAEVHAHSHFAASQG